ncbi:NAD(P)-binding protein [Plenodomus tracheiphilus IPT5]|uniref:NAD(P)-binding protein n=1 Tax=Plenodomus tracheiphilus IPT5 TaxID=1408161 RepID=A0A6A7BAY6_9PLEO|nr:NAD(P)-binding protein [Plenodomus tracheiphilus IPT5]
MSNNNVLVFGPTGAVGRHAALTAAAQGATVWLAMRDPSKSIPELPSTSPSYHRIQADLSDASSLTAAVKKSNAKSAFVYVLQDSSDHMLSAFTALKEAGIGHVVLLSSYSVQGDPGDQENQEEHIPRLHANAEISLRSTGITYTAIRPAYFNSNMTWFFGSDLGTGHVRILYPETKLDWIASNDIGAVAGIVLAKPPNKTEIIYLCGPEMLSQRQALGIVGEVLGKKLEVEEVSERQWYEKMVGFPMVLLEMIARGLSKRGQGSRATIADYPKETYEEGIRNVERITGRKATVLRDWVKENRAMIEGLGKA